MFTEQRDFADRPGHNDLVVARISRSEIVRQPEVQGSSERIVQRAGRRAQRLRQNQGAFEVPEAARRHVAPVTAGLQSRRMTQRERVHRIRRRRQEQRSTQSLFNRVVNHAEKIRKPWGPNCSWATVARKRTPGFWSRFLSLWRADRPPRRNYFSTAHPAATLPRWLCSSRTAKS